MGTKAMIAAEHPLEARAAQKVLEAGGNAIDAAVAAFYMTTVVEPQYAGIGGDAFILAYLADKRAVVFINGSGHAPALATCEKYLGIGGIPDAGPLATSMPGAVAGFDLALRKYGTRDYTELVQPAIDAALHGHPVSFWSAANHAGALAKISKYPSSVRAFLKNGEPLEPGDVLVQPDLAQTLHLHVVTEVLKLAFADRNQYIADPRFVRDMPVEGLLSQDYADKRRGLIRMDVAISGVAPPGEPRRSDPVLAGHQISYSAGPSPVVHEIADAGSAIDGDTSSFSIADPYGNVVSVTHSVAGLFGSGMVVEELGFVLNNRMEYFGLEESDVNVLAPGKRVRQTSSPALALKDGRPFLAWNTPGVDNQPQAMLQAFLNVVEFGMNVQQAVEAPTIVTSSFRQSKFPQPAPNVLAIPRLLADRVGVELTRRGHILQVSELQPPYLQTPSGAGAVKMVLTDSARGVIFGSVSPAKDNFVAGW